MEHVLPGQPSCPRCGERATARAEACADCGYRFLQASSPRTPSAMRANRRRLLALALAAGAVAAVGSAALAIGGGPEEADPGPERRSAAREVRPTPDLLSSHPLSAGAAERRLEARFTSPRDDDSAAARCSALQPRPAHAIRRCRIRYPGGTERTVVVLTNPQGHELLIDRD